MAVLERLFGSKAVPIAKIRERFQKQPATFASAALLLGLSIPIGLSFKFALHSLKSYAEMFAVAEAELAALRLDRSIAQFRRESEGGYSSGGVDNCLPNDNLLEQYPSAGSIRFESLSSTLHPSSLASYSLAFVPLQPQLLTPATPRFDWGRKTLSQRFNTFQNSSAGFGMVDVDSFDSAQVRAREGECFGELCPSSSPRWSIAQASGSIANPSINIGAWLNGDLQKLGSPRLLPDATIPSEDVSPDTANIFHGDSSICQWLEPLSTESLTPTLPTVTGELRSYWFLLDEFGHPVFTPERISGDYLDGWSAPDASQWEELARSMNLSQQGISSRVLGGRIMYVAHSRLEEADLMLGLAIPQKDFNRHVFYLNALMWLVGAGGVAAATSIGLSITNHRSAESARGELRNMELRSERERLTWQAYQKQQHEQLQVQREETVKTISNSMTGPLTNLKQAITLLSDYGTTLHPTQLKGYTEVMEQAIGRLANTFDRIVSLRDLDSNSLAPRLAPVNLSQLCADLVSRCRTGDNVRIELNFRGTCGTVYLDSYLVQVALDPILRNAVKYSGNHPELPPIEFTVDCRASDNVEFTVVDKGLGIPEGDLSTVLQPFVRGQNVYHIPGTGLGLAIAKQAIEAMEGELEIISRQGAGTTVTVVVPTTQSSKPAMGW